MHITDELLCRILSNEKHSKISILKWYIKDGIVDTGDSHTSELSRLHVIYQKKNRIFNRTFILKVPSAHPFFKTANTYGIYSREYLVYTNILEEMYKLDGDRMTPRLYYADNKNSLMLKDLSQSGYKLEDRTKQLDYDQCTLVFRNLAKFHALSIKLNQLSKIPAEMNQLTWFKRIEDPEDMISIWIKNAFDQFVANVDSSITQHFRHLNLKDELGSISAREVSFDNFSFCTLNHGDCWNGNIMFKSDKYGNLKKMKLIDFQNCFWTSPAYDILHFTLCSMQFEVYENKFDMLLDTYVSTLNKVLKYLRCDLYKVESLREDMKKLRHYGLLALIALLPEFISSREDPLDCRFVFRDEENIDFETLNRIYANELYLEVLKKWMQLYIRQGYF